MPYGFIQAIEQKGYSEETIKSYEKVIQQFFSFIGSTYPQNKEPFQISPSDIKQYLKEQQEKQKSISTINKELAIIKTLFNYLWEIDKVPVDPTVKIRRIKLQERINLEITYQEILELQIKVLNNPSYSPLRKVIFLLATKGLKTADFRFTKQHVSISSTRNQVEIDLSNRMITLDGVEATIFKEYYYESLTNNNHYVFITKHRAKEDPGPIQVMSILTHLRAISKDLLPEHVPALTLISIRKALIYDLYKKRISIQSIANQLGIEEISASNYLKTITEGVFRQKTNTV
ncbi:site-specific integrase [Bacillus sp. DNRA2]|uniref:tyrosine-type recombinase/integrase n=1 Tax=Bacillus sp. DNRA2 TaxID=2723053 RepID=UPI00145C5BBA|nr:phage integrase N-terminal SAM-like domain-containing protein [Bacillus sp. DNRA2]NMD70456.1 site-specific integrase [Bacillus sp. DNRA2]